MQPEIFMLWTFVGFIACALIVGGIIDAYEHWNKCRHKWTAWSTPEKPETYYGYAYQTRCCKTCNQFEKRDIT